MKISIQHNGSSVAIILRGSQKEIEETYNLFYNWRALDEEPRVKATEVAVVWTSTKQFLHGLTEIWANRLYNLPTTRTEFKGKRGGFYKLAEKLAKQDFEQMPRETFFRLHEKNI